MLTTEHNLKCPKEIKRIQKCGGEVRAAPSGPSKSPRDNEISFSHSLMRIWVKK